MSNELSLSVRIMADAARYASGLAGGVRETSKFASSVKREIESVKSTFGSLKSQLALVTGGLTAMKLAADSAKLDKSLTGIKLTAEATRKEADQLRKDLFRMAQDSGRNVDDLMGGFNNLVQMGQDWRSAKQEIEATNVAMAVTNASADKLTSALGVASVAYQFDLSQPGKALELLDKMTVAGRKGNAELENLADVFGRYGVNFASAGLGFEKSLGFVEVLSLVERQPERLATLADSTLRVFTNNRYRKEAQKATGVKFFDKDGERRDALEVMEDLRRKFKKIKSTERQESFLGAAFGKADNDTMKGMRILFSGDLLDKVGEFTKSIHGASGTLTREMPEAINNAVDQTGRLKASLREAADGFVQPINEAFTHVAGFMMDSRDKGGLGLSGKEMLIGGATIAGAGVVGGYVAKWLGELFGKKVPGLGKGIPGVGNLAGMGVNIATGKALQEAAGVTPVYVVNMPAGGLGAGGLPGALPGLPGGAAGAAAGSAAGVAGSRAAMALAMGLPLKEFLGLGAAAWGTAAAGVGVAGAAGYGVGTLAYKSLEGTMAGDGLVDKVGGGIARILALFGNENAKQALAINEKLKNTELGGTMKIVVETSAGASATVTAAPTNPRLRYQVGQTMQGAN